MTKRVRKRRTRPVFVVLALLSIAFVGVIGTIIFATAIWPGEAKLTASLFCPPGRPDAFVVEDVRAAAGRRTSNLTMYCVGERGDYTKIGWARPFLTLMAVHTALFGLFVVALRIYFRRKRANRAPVEAGLTSPGTPTT